MAIVLISTTDAAGRRWPQFKRFTDSLAESAKSYPTVRSHVLVQNAGEGSLSAYRDAAPPFCRFYRSPDQMSLSSARNELLAEVFADGALTCEDIIGFPDDDCWYTDRFLRDLAGIFEARKDLGLLVCRVSLEPDSRPFGVDDVVPAKASQIVRLSSSNNMFFRADLSKKTGTFDASLGVGTPIGGAEDTDYAIRASLLAREVGLVDRPLVGHRAPDACSTARYYRGSLLVLARYAWCRPALCIEFLRKLLVGLYLIARGQLALKAFWAAILLCQNTVQPRNAGP